MKERKEAVPAAQMDQPKKKRAGRPKLQLTGDALKEHRKALQKKADARYHKRLKEGRTDNPAALESRQTFIDESLISFQAKKIKVLNIRSKKELFKENVQLKKQLKMQEALLKANATQVQTMIAHL